MEDYYTHQAGSGLAIYEGHRFQRGHGFLGNFIKGPLWSVIKRVLPYIGRQALSTGNTIADRIGEGESFKSAAKSVLKRKAGEIALDAVGRIVQKGTGRKRRRTAAPIKGKRKRKTRDTLF